MNLLCLFRHDWQILKAFFESDIKYSVKEENIKKKEFIQSSFLRQLGEPEYKEKICLRCGKRKDTITPFINKVIKDTYRMRERLQKARELAGASQ